MRGLTMPSVLPLDTLLAHGISVRALRVWRERGVTQLLPLQSAAIADHGVLQGQSLIVFAPTSSGKTLIAELAALRHIEARRRVLYLVPTKALAEERGEEFHARFGALGARVLIATRERPEADEAILRGEWDLVVAIYEKVRSFLVARPALLAEVGLVVADELQMLGELRRGDAVELILTKMTRAPYRAVQFLGLSAVLGDADRIGAWLGSEVLASRGRPVELREGVVCAADGQFRFRALNAQTWGEERLLDPAALAHPPAEMEAPDLILAVAEALAARGEAVLVFAPTKRLTREWALALAGRLSLPPACGALARLAAAEPSLGREMLAECLRRGVAFHNADLPAALRTAVEHAYDAGEVRVLISTSTLAQGVNLTGRNVVVAPQQVETDRWTGEPVAAALSRARFQNMGGRAGRLGREADFGRAILVAATPEEAERLLGLYVAQPPEPLEPALESADLAPVVLDLIASGLARRPRAVEDFLLATYTGLTRWQHLPPADWQDRWLGALERLRALHLVREDEEGDLAATGLGREAARAGIAVKTALLFSRWLEAIEAEPTPLETLWCACRSVDAAEAPLPLARTERQSHALIDHLTETLTALGGPAHPQSAAWLRPEGGLTPEDLAAAKKALLLWAWLGPTPTEEIEQTFGSQAGAIEHLAGHVAWLVETLANIATALGHPDQRTGAWRRLARRLPKGLPEGGEAWAALHLLGLGRAHVRALLTEGFETPEDLEGVRLADLARVVPEPLAEALLTLRLDTPPPPRAPARPARPPEPAEAALPEVDPETGTVRWLGRETRLTPKPAALLALLVARAPRAVSYREIEDTVWPPGEAAERQQISAHMRRVLKALAAIDPERAAGLIEVRAGQGLRIRGG